MFITRRLLKRTDRWLIFRCLGRCDKCQNIPQSKTVPYFCGAMRLADLGPQSATKTECHATLLALQLGQFLDGLFKENGIIIKDCFLFGDSDIALSRLCSISAHLKFFYSSRYRVTQALVKKLHVKTVQKMMPILARNST